MKAFAALAVAFTLSMLADSSHAACGGGGWKKSSKPATEQVRRSESSSHHVSYSRNSPTESVQVQRSAHPQEEIRYAQAPSRPFDSARLDGLNLSERQYERISSLRRSIDNETERQHRKIEKAQRKLAECRKNCDDEARKVADEQLRLQDLQYQFDASLRQILSPSQYNAYVGR